jgi:hypothetical protein
MLLWMLSTPFVGIFGSEDGGQTNDGPLVERASSYQVTRLRESVNPGHGPAYRLQVSLIDDRRTVSQVHGPGI